MPKIIPTLTTVIAAFVASAPTNSNAAVGTGSQADKAFTSEAVRTTIKIKAEKSPTNTTATKPHKRPVVPGCNNTRSRKPGAVCPLPKKE